MAAGGADPITAVELSRQGQQTFGKLEESDKPVVAAIDGYCLGGGMELATATDLRVASERSELGQPEHNLGLPGGGRHPAARPHRRRRGAREGDHLHRRPLRGGDAGGLRLHQRSRPRRRARRARESWSSSLAAGPPIAQKYTKRAMHAGRTDGEAGLEVEAMGFGHTMMNTDDLMEGVTAFMGDGEPSSREGK